MPSASSKAAGSWTLEDWQPEPDDPIHVRAPWFCMHSMTDMLFKQLEEEWRESAGLVPLRQEPESPMWNYNEDGSSQCRLCYKSMANSAYQFWNHVTSREHRKYCCNTVYIDAEAVAYEEDWFSRVTDQCNQLDHLLVERMEPGADEPGPKTPRRFASAPTKPSLDAARHPKEDPLPDASAGSAKTEPRRATLGQKVVDVARKSKASLPATAKAHAPVQTTRKRRRISPEAGDSPEDRANFRRLSGGLAPKSSRDSSPPAAAVPARIPAPGTPPGSPLGPRPPSTPPVMLTFAPTKVVLQFWPEDCSSDQVPAHSPEALERWAAREAGAKPGTKDSLTQAQPDEPWFALVGIPFNMEFGNPRTPVANEESLQPFTKVEPVPDLWQE